MAGLLSGAAPAPSPTSPTPASGVQPPADPMTPTAPQDAVPDDDTDTGAGQPNVTPEEQQAYTEFVTNALHIIFPQGAQAQISPDILAQLKAKGDPVNALAQTTIAVVVPLEQSAEKAQAPWTQDDQMKSDILLHGGIAVLEELAQAAQAAGIHDYTQAEMQGAMYQALDMYRQLGTQDGSIDQNDLKSQFQTIVTADKQGDVQSVLPQLKGGDSDAGSVQGSAAAPAATPDTSFIDPRSVADDDQRRQMTTPDMTRG